jgi:hypothetical protein
MRHTASEYRTHRSARTSTVGSHRYPVRPSTTLSNGPPLLTAITGLQPAIASMGTMPKCSFEGVYSTALAARSRYPFCASENERMNVTGPSASTCWYAGADAPAAIGKSGSARDAAGAADSSPASHSPAAAARCFSSTW